ncbi:MAG: hypothetical protein LBN98_06655 [Prevotellaceae bacterium]|jgi:hypothetical protein|nr:hypothetical protein [Prevotellaceae bacterium]
MKKYLIIGIIIVSLIAAIAALTARINYLANERNIYQSNTHALLDSVRRYKINDSLHAASAKQLQLTLNEYKHYRASDYALIKQLKADKRRLEQVTTLQTEAVYELSAPKVERVAMRDSIIRDTVRCYVYEDTWLSFDGCIAGATFAGTVKSRDSLVYVEHIIPKRFLGFLWKYGVKERRQEIISKNPHTEIMGAEFITIRE